MTKNLDSRKYKLIRAIMALDNENQISHLEEQVYHFNGKDKFWEAIKPIRKEMTLEEMIAEQNYAPVSAGTFFEQAAQIGMTETIEEILETLD
ncbi:MAG: hypothetical protein ACPG19_02880 [Saprospiraceae bacterium]